MDTPVKFIKGVGEKRAQLLNRMGIFTLYDAVRFYPRTYLDFSSLTPISEIVPDTVCCFSAVVGYDPIKHLIRKNMTVYKTMVTDGVNGVNITIFNNSYLAESLETGKEYIFYGKVTASRGSLEISNPIVESADEGVAMRPIYHQTASLTSRMTERIMHQAVNLYLSRNIPDIIPDKIRQGFKLCHGQFAVKNIHFPENPHDLEIAKRRLAFEELLILQIGMKRLRSSNEKHTEHIIKKDYSEEFMSLLPFELTSAQKRAIADSLSDMKSGKPMNRLIQGDVGSGKTAVAACLLYVSAKNGLQSAFMAPTEILAKQHYNTLCNMLGEKGITVEFLTGSVTAKKKREIKERLRNGEVHIIVGTHALLSDDVEFSNLGLVITDEQHRFGVAQRGKLIFKGANPHTLVMSATPIPRTLSLIIYGDLDLTVIDERPKGRQKTDTYCVGTSYRPRIYSFIKKHLDSGLQAYIVCPAVEDNPDSDITNVTDYCESLSENEFSDYRVGLLHGKMKPKDKERVMADFLSGEIQLLISTTVIEVGVDVPNSVIMVIEDADRFGLSQLHQLRGRVGRGREKSYCILISDGSGEETRKRLGIMCRTNDGFLIADEDLKIRGPGDFFGARQHGLPDLKIADLTTDMPTVRQSKKACDMILAADPTLSLECHKSLAAAVDRLFSSEKSLSFN
ncbi:MAG: ATP-dependent DNA helicase RecG [Clostridia bacterium]|nr:ATP-dependent DNA helicase RecG [Clostridia bacterium]